MAHRKKYAITSVEELKALIEKAKAQKSSN
jgi:hypothetical protein